MPLFSLLAVIFSMIGLCMTVFTLIPHFNAAYRERYQVRLVQTGRELNKFFIDIKPTRIMIIACVLGGLVGLLTESIVFALTIAVAGIFAPRIILSIWKSMRSSQVENQLQDALALIGNALRSGLDIAAGIELVSTNMKAPISEEFGLVLNAYKLGAPLEMALNEMGARVNSKVLDTVIASINIQRDSGGNIIKTFEQLIVTIREESKLQKKVKALTAQGRMQIYFLAVLPWALAAIFFMIAPENIQAALANPYGQMALVGIVIWEIIGFMVTKKIVTVEI